MKGTGMRRAIRVCLGLAVVLAAAWGGSASAQAASSTVMLVRLSGVVDPFIAAHIRGAITDAASAGDGAVLLEIDTPGGLDSSMRQIVQAVANARIPVICYVAPQGARAASAGAFVLISCPVAAMAPGTNVGAATPVGLAGAVESQKALNDAIAYIRSLAEQRHRNADVAASFVRDAASITAQQALEQNVIDAIAPNTDTLLTSISGRQVTLADGTVVTLDTAGAKLVEDPMGVVSGFLHGLVDPSLAFLFFWLGLALLVVEFIFPGHLVSGITGLALLILALLSFGLLPVSLVGVALLAFSVVFFVLEARHPGLGVWGVLGLLTLVLGGLFLFNGTGAARVSPFMIVPVALGAAGFFGFVTAQALAVRRMPAPPGNERIVGTEGVALGGGLDPNGVVRVAAEQWKAVSGSGAIAAGARVRVTAIEGLVLTVEPVEATPETTPETANESGPETPADLSAERGSR